MGINGLFHRAMEQCHSCPHQLSGVVIVDRNNGNRIHKRIEVINEHWEISTAARMQAYAVKQYIGTHSDMCVNGEIKDGGLENGVGLEKIEENLYLSLEVVCSL